MSNQAIDPNNPQTNQNPYPQEDNYNMNIQNFNMDIHQQKQIIDNLINLYKKSNEDLNSEIERIKLEKKLEKEESNKIISEFQIPIFHYWRSNKKSQFLFRDFYHIKILF